jgi:hypothetical protein
MVFLYYICTSMYMIICSLMIIEYAFSANILFISMHHGFLIAIVISIMFLHFFHYESNISFIEITNIPNYQQKTIEKSKRYTWNVWYCNRAGLNLIIGVLSRRIEKSKRCTCNVWYCNRGASILIDELLIVLSKGTT